VAVVMIGVDPHNASHTAVAVGADFLAWYERWLDEAVAGYDVGWFGERLPLEKPGKVATIPLAPRTARAIDLAIGERTSGPLFRAADGERLDRHGAARIVRRVTRRAGISKQVSPHALRHAFITAALDAGVPLRDVQEAASHADPRTTMRYDRARTSLDRHATYIVATYIAGAAR
jgi:integrase/recombinase XerD